MRIVKLTGDVCRGREGVVLLKNFTLIMVLQSWLIESVRDMPIWLINCGWVICLNELQPVDLQCVKCCDCSLCTVVTWRADAAELPEPPWTCLCDALSCAQSAGDGKCFKMSLTSYLSLVSNMLSLSFPFSPLPLLTRVKVLVVLLDYIGGSQT